jgi:hypothetical protein
MPIASFGVKRDQKRTAQRKAPASVGAYEKLSIMAELLNKKLMKV